MESYSFRCSAFDNETWFGQDLKVRQDVLVPLVLLDLWGRKVRSNDGHDGIIGQIR